MEAPQQSSSRSTLGDVLYAGPAQPLVPEKDWIDLVRSTAAGDYLALRDLYERTHRVVFTLIMRTISNRAIAEDLTLDVYHDVWQRASRFDGANATVVGWIMNKARFKAIDRMRFEQRSKQSETGQSPGLLPIDTPDYRDLLQVKEQGRVLRRALTILAAEERAAIEAAYFSELTYVEVAARLSQTAATVKARLHAGLRKVREALPKAGKGASLAQADPCDQAQTLSAHALHALPQAEVPPIENHLASCTPCRRELEALRSVVDSFIAWPTDVLRAPAALEARLEQRIAAQSGGKSALPVRRQRAKPEWEEVAPGISCKLLATDAENAMVSMLVRLVPGGEYPAHTHAGTEELHLLDGELWIDERKLQPGDYYRAEAGTGDSRVWSATGCTCVLITSTKDLLR
jgi:RNA polymerase sigma factor (sigma-70 family)